MSTHQSVAESVLAELATMNEPAESSAPAPADADAEDTSGEASIADAPDDAVELEEDGGAVQTLSWAEALERVPPDIRRLMRQMQGDYTRKTQQLAEQRRDLLREREALLKGSQSIKAPEELPEYDPFNEQSIQARIEAEVARRLRDVLDPMEQEYNVMRAEDSYRSFLTEHPDLETDQPLRDAVQELLEQNDQLDLETAYWAARGRRARAEAAQEQNSRSARKRAERQAAMRGTGSSVRSSSTARPSRQELRSMSAADIYRLAESMHKS